MKPRILLIGVGDLGSLVLDGLAREEWVGSLVAASRSVASGEARCNLARSCAFELGTCPEIRFLPLNLDREEDLGRAIRVESPDLIIHMATMFSWWLPDLLPPENRARLKEAGFGMWLPVNLALAVKLFRTLREEGFRGRTINVPFPDVINCILSRQGMAPTCGVGNLEELVPKLRFLVSRERNVPASTLDIRLVAHHALESAVLTGSRDDRIPFYLRVACEGEDITAAAGAREKLWVPYSLVGGRAINFLTAACVVRLCRAMFSSEEDLIHVPGPGGLPGGYPVQVSGAGLRLAETPGLTREEAVRINEASQRFDGIEGITGDGSVVFRSESVEIFRDQLGYDCPVLAPGEEEGRALELIRRFREYAAGQGVNI